MLQSSWLFHQVQEAAFKQTKRILKMIIKISYFKGTATRVAELATLSDFVLVDGKIVIEAVEMGVAEVRDTVVFLMEISITVFVKTEEGVTVSIEADHFEEIQEIKILIKCVQTWYLSIQF